MVSIVKSGRKRTFTGPVLPGYPFCPRTWAPGPEPGNPELGALTRTWAERTGTYVERKQYPPPGHNMAKRPESDEVPGGLPLRKKWRPPPPEVLDDAGGESQSSLLPAPTGTNRNVRLLQD